MRNLVDESNAPVVVGPNKMMMVLIIVGVVVGMLLCLSVAARFFLAFFVWEETSVLPQFLLSAI